MAKTIKTIGVLTSGGDAPGMNAAIRAVVRKSLNNGIGVKGIKKGYMGLLNEEIIDMDAKTVSDTIQRGGTVLGTARCLEFKEEKVTVIAQDAFIGRDKENVTANLEKIIKQQLEQNRKAEVDFTTQEKDLAKNLKKAHLGDL